jgi:LPS export ABC transporter protein LptC
MKTLARFRIAAVLLVVVTGCTRHESAVTVDEALAQAGPDQESWAPDMWVSEQGIPRLHMVADHMARHETPDSTWMVLTALPDSSRRVEVTLFNDSGEQTAVVQANEVTWYEAQKRFTARGDVRVETTNGRNLWSEHLDWNEATQRVGTPGYATIRTPTQTIRGWGLDADENLDDLHLSRVSGTVIPEEGTQ